MFALAALACAAASSHAQSNVTIYGIMDSGLKYANHANAAQQSVTRVTSGGQNTSRFGFRSTEDLGGGLKALFNLEGRLFLDTGSSDGVMFKRQANVELRADFGRVVPGRSFTTTYDLLLPFDPLGFAPNYSWVTSGNGTAASKYGSGGSFSGRPWHRPERGLSQLQARRWRSRHA